MSNYIKVLSFWVSVLFIGYASAGSDILAESLKINYFSTDMHNCAFLLDSKNAVAPVDPGLSGIRSKAGEFKVKRKSANWNNKHTGVDVILSDLGRSRTVIPVRAIADGKVVLNALKGGFDSSYGYTKILDHGNGCFSIYTHLTDNNHFVDSEIQSQKELGKKRGQI